MLIVPYSKGLLTEEVRKGIEKCKEPKGVRTRVQEGGGTKLRDRLMRADPFPRDRCFRRDCPVVSRGTGECRETCFQGHATYVARCKECADKRKSAVAARAGNEKIPLDEVYIGETSRGLYVRHSTHQEKYRALKASGFMHRHAEEKHEGSKETKYVFERTSSDRDPMRRIIRESIQIVKASEDENLLLMNSKDEYFGVQVSKPVFSHDWL